MNDLDLMNDIIAYIKDSFSNDVDFSKIKVEKAYKAENEIATPEIDIYLSDEGEDIISNSYDDENISIKLLTLYCYNKAMVFGDNDSKNDAVESTMILTDRLKTIMNKNNVSKNNKNIISLTRRSVVPPQDLRDGIIYVSIIRYEIKVLNNYEKIYNE